MIVKKKRIRNLTPYIGHLNDGSNIVIGLLNPAEFSSILKRIGFSEPFKRGQTILPSPSGPITRYNAEGKEIVHKDKPMETAYRQTEWSWQQWDGSWHSKIVDVPYKRYPRSFIPPPSIEITITENNDGLPMIVGPSIEKTEKNIEKIKHIINLFLETFGECEIFTANLESIFKSPLKRLNWVILPQGEIPWEQFKKDISYIVENAPEGNRGLLYYRLKTVNEFKPDFRAIGKGGFHGYIVHGFTKKKIYLLESMYYGNATYVLDETWEMLSQRTKAEILNQNLQKERIIHKNGWGKRIKEVINS